MTVVNQTRMHSGRSSRASQMVMAADIHVEQDLADRIDINHCSSYTNRNNMKEHI